MLTFNFKTKVKDIPKVLEQSFLNRMKEVIELNVRNSLEGSMKKSMVAEVNLVNGILRVKVVDLSGKGKLKREDLFEDEVSEEEYFNIITEDSLKNRVAEGVKKATQDISKILIEVESFYRK